MKEDQYLENTFKERPLKASDKESNAVKGIVTLSADVYIVQPMPDDPFNVLPVRYLPFTYLDKDSSTAEIAMQDGSEVRVNVDIILAIQYFNHE